MDAWVGCGMYNDLNNSFVSAAVSLGSDGDVTLAQMLRGFFTHSPCCSSCNSSLLGAVSDRVAVSFGAFAGKFEGIAIFMFG